MQVIVSKKDEKLLHKKGAVSTSHGLGFSASKWNGVDEVNRLDVRAICVCPSHLKFEIRIEMWGTPSKDGPKVHLRTLIDTDTAVFTTDDIGPVITTYFTVTEHEVEQNQGAKERGQFYFTCWMKGTQR